MRHYNLTTRELLDFTEEEIWDLDRPATVTLTFDDGEVIDKTDTVDICISWYFWQIAHRYRKLDVTRKLYLDGRPLTDSVLRDMMWASIEDTVDDPEIDREDVWWIAYRETYNKLYNALAERLLSFISGTQVPDIIELLFDEEIHAANERVTYNKRTVERAYDVIRNVVMTKYDHNPIVRAVRNKTVPMNQILQSIGPRGLVTDIDSVIFKRPITRGFAQGFRGIGDWLKESRSAAKALLFNKDPVRTAEYFNRKLQLVVAYLRKIVPGDCGTSDVHVFNIPTGTEGENLVESMAGLFQLMDDGSFREILLGDTFLVGTEVKFRTTMCCLHLHEQKVCEVCYGKIAYNIPHDTNPGHVSCTELNKLITQLIISTKHLDFIIYKFIAILRGNEPMYLQTREVCPENIYLNPKKVGRRINLRIKSIEAPRLVDINYITDVSNSTPAKISVLSEVEISEIDENGILFTENNIDPMFDLTKMASKPSLSIELLKYVKRKGWGVHGNYIDITIDTDWDGDDPLFMYPLKHVNMSEYGCRVERFIRSTSDVGDDDDTKLKAAMKKSRTVKQQVMLNQYRDPTKALYDAWYLVSEKLTGVSLGHIATIAAVTRAEDARNNDYYMPSGLKEGRFVSHDALINNRDLAVSMLYQKQYVPFDTISSYLAKDRPASVMQDLIYISPKKARFYAESMGRLEK